MKAFASALVCLWLPLTAHGSTATPLDLTLAPPDRLQLDHVQRGEVEALQGGERLRRFVFEPSAQPSVRVALVAPAAGDALRLRVQNAMAWAVTAVVTVCTGGVSILPSLSRCTTTLPPVYEADSKKRPLRSVAT